MHEIHEFSKPRGNLLCRPSQRFQGNAAPDFVNKYNWLSPEVQIGMGGNGDDEENESDAGLELSFKFQFWDLEDPYRNPIKQTSLVHKAFPLVFAHKRTIVGKLVFGDICSRVVITMNLVMFNLMELDTRTEALKMQFPALPYVIVGTHADLVGSNANKLHIILSNRYLDIFALSDIFQI